MTRASSWDVSGAAAERWSLEEAEHGLAIALLPKLVAIVTAGRPDAVLLGPLGDGGSSSLLRRRVLPAPSGPLRALKFFAQDSSGCTLLLAVAPHEAYLWDISGKKLCLDQGANDASVTPLRLVGVEAPAAASPALAFDETGALVAIGGSDGGGTPKLLVFGVASGAALVLAEVPGRGGINALGGGAGDGGAACTSVITACGFLREEFAFVLIVAVHVVGSHRGHVLAHDLHGCGTAADGPKSFACAHETESMEGAPFLAVGSHHLHGSIFLLGGEGVVRMLQVEQTSGRHLACVALAEVLLGGNRVPVWLRSSGHSNEEATHSPSTTPGEGVLQDDGGVLAVEAIGCRVAGGGAPASLGLYGTAAIAVTAGAVYAVWGHARRAELLSATPALSSAAVCAAPCRGTLLAGYLHAFAGGGQIIRLTLSADLQVAPDASSASSLSKPTALQSPRTLGAPPLDALVALPSGSPCDVGTGSMAGLPVCSVMLPGAIPENSMLGRALAPSRPSTPAGRGTGGAPSPGMRRAGSAPLRHRSGQAMLADQPVTFHRKVKSAGYGPPTEPPRVPGQPRLSATAGLRAAAPKPNFGRPPPGHARPSSRPGSASGVAGALGRYAAAASIGPPLDHCPEHRLHAYECAITDLCYVPQATHLVVAGSDRTISSYKLPLGRRSSGGTPSTPPRPLGLGGHSADILSMFPSYSDSHSTGGGGGPLLLTAAADHTARLWALGGPHAGSHLLCIDRLRTNTKPAHRGENPQLEQVQDAQFLCLDGAIALAVGARLSIYKYALHVQDASDDIRRLQRLGSYKCCGLLSLPREPSSGHNIVAMAANNAVLSGTILVASSSKRIYAWDVAAEKVLAGAAESSLHSRPVTCLRLLQPHEEFQTLESMDVFYTAATDNTVKLWDLRTMEECRCFAGAHVHTSQRLRCRVTPCLRYLCMPSEDGSVCAYDVRTGKSLGTRHCHRDVVSAVDVHPRSGAMASAGFDGTVQFYRAPWPDAQPTRVRGGRPPGGLVERQEGVREVEMEVPM